MGLYAKVFYIMESRDQTTEPVEKRTNPTLTIKSIERHSTGRGKQHLKCLKY